MPRNQSQILLPAVANTADGNPRKIGVELEMGDIKLDEASRIVAAHVSGDVEVLSEVEHKIHQDDHGDWIVELDFAFLKKIAAGKKIKSDDNSLGKIALDAMKSGAERVVPVEVVTPPLKMEELSTVVTLVEKLRKAGARGTSSEMIYAFGMQFNPEVPDTSAETIVAYFKAFLCLFDWLVEQSNIDFTRRLTPYIDQFPKKYVRQVIDTGYWPDMDTLIGDYLDSNPTRNRALDMLPLFTHINEEQVRTIVDDDRIKARPTFHYRLPNCEIDREDWNIDRAWNDWLQVEALAHERNLLEKICITYGEVLDKPGERFFGDWPEPLQQWLPIHPDH